MYRVFALAAASCLLSLAVPAAASAAAITPTPLTFDVVIGPSDDTHCRVDADLYKPPGVSKSNPAAAVLATNGFGGSKSSAGLVALAQSYAQRGYVFLSYSGLGFGHSGCK